MRIYLIGYMGCGKSTVAKYLTERISFLSNQKYFVFDTDEYIENTEKTVISEIFKRSGEQYFRQLETQALEKTLEYKNVIVATGGGIILKKENLDIMRANGKIVYLQVSVEELARRIKTDNRPLLAGLTGESLIYKITAMLEAREELYESADIIINSTNQQPLETAKAIAEKLEY